jgi:hypothetical protein
VSIREISGKRRSLLHFLSIIESAQTRSELSRTSKSTSKRNCCHLTLLNSPHYGVETRPKSTLRRGVPVTSLSAREVAVPLVHRPKSALRNCFRRPPSRLLLPSPAMETSPQHMLYTASELHARSMPQAAHNQHHSDESCCAESFCPTKHAYEVE